MADTGHALGWNSEIENDGSTFEPLPAGRYWFRVLDWSRGKSDAKKCDTAKLKIEIRNVEGKASKMTETLLLHSNFEWKLSSFFRSIDEKQHGKKYVMDWTKVKGAFGWARVKVEQFTTMDNAVIDINRVDAFLDRPEGSSIPAWVKEPLDAQRTLDEAQAVPEDDCPF